MSATIHTHPSSKAIYLRLLGYVRPHWKVFAVAILAMGATAATEPLLPALLKALFDSGFGPNATAHPAWYYPLILVSIFLLRGVVGFVADYALAWVGNRLVMDLRNAAFERLVNLPTHYFESTTTGEMVSKLTNDVTGVTNAATTVLTVAVRDTITLIGLLGWLLYLNWQLTLIAISITPIIALIVSKFGGRLREISRQAQRSLGRLNHILEEAIGGHRIVKVFGGQQYEVDRFHHASQEQRGLSMRQTIAAGAQGPFVQIFVAIALGLIIGIAQHQSHSDQTTIGSFVSFITAMLMLLAPTKRLTDINAPLQRGLAAAESVFEQLDAPTESDQGQPLTTSLKGHVRIENLTMRYEGANRDALHQINLDIQPGSCIALVGGSGGGKSTLANLITRFYTPTSGRICVDDLDIQTIRLLDLRANLALVSQDVVLFNDTVAANIAYGQMQHASLQDIERAARAAHAHDYISALPEGYQTQIGENGVKLSGGQRQRLAIARALLKNAPILILDEATSALDTESEKAVQAALDVLMQGRTTIVIAHRLSTIEHADCIVVLQGGEIVEQGKHAELLAANGTYARLHGMQFKDSAA